MRHVSSSQLPRLCRCFHQTQYSSPAELNESMIQLSDDACNETSDGMEFLEDESRENWLCPWNGKKRADSRSVIIREFLRAWEENRGKMDPETALLFSLATLDPRGDSEFLRFLVFPSLHNREEMLQWLRGNPKTTVSSLKRFCVWEEILAYCWRESSLAATWREVSSFAEKSQELAGVRETFQQLCFLQELAGILSFDIPRYFRDATFSRQLLHDSLLSEDERANRLAVSLLRFHDSELVLQLYEERIFAVISGTFVIFCFL